METNNTASTKIDGSKVRFWAKRTQAQEAARSIGWALSCVCKVETRFQIGYALSMGADRDPYTGGPFLSRERFAKLYYQRNPAPIKTAYQAGAEKCPQRIALPVPQRPGNVLNVEIGLPVPRCRCRTPESWGGFDPRAVRWLNSGGSALVLGPCSAEACPLPAG